MSYSKKEVFKFILLCCFFTVGILLLTPPFLATGADDNIYIWIEAEKSDVKKGRTTPTLKKIEGASGVKPEGNCLSFYENRHEPGLDTATWKNIQIPKPGDYILWVRMKDVSRTGGRFTIKWNNRTVFDSFLLTKQNKQEWTWFKIGYLKNISSGGNLTFSRGNTMCWMSYLDCLLLTTDSDYVPSGISKPKNTIIWQSSFLSYLDLSNSEKGERMGNIKENKALEWIRKKKIRATYTWAPRSHHKNPKKVISDIYKVGFNAIFLKGLKADKQGEDWISTANKYHIRIFSCFNFFSIHSNGKMPEYMKNYRKVVYKDGKEGKAPCPLDEKYWNERVLPNLLEITRLSLKEKNVVGALMDTEMYGLKPHAFLEDVCFCDECFRQFLKSIKKEHLFSEINRKDRYKWLKSEGLLGRYYYTLEKRLIKITKHLREKVHEVNPNLILGNLNYVNTWFFRGLAKGWGTKRMPALIAPESPSYTKGYTPFVNEEVKRFKKERFFVFYIPGIWDIQFYPKDLARHCYKLAINSDGFWDFTIRGFYPGLLPDFYNELIRKSGGSIQEYWNAFSLANEEITRKMKEGYNYQSKLDIERINLAKGKKVVALEPKNTSGSTLNLTDGCINFSKPVCWDLSNGNKIIIVIDLGSVKPVSEVKALFQGGGYKNGLYFPSRMEVYGNAKLLPIADSKWDDPSDSNYFGKTSKPDVKFSFPENGWHSFGAYQRWMTVRKKKPVGVQFIKIVVYKQLEAYAKKVTKIGEEVPKQILMDEIEVY